VIDPRSGSNAVWKEDEVNGLNGWKSAPVKYDGIRLEQFSRGCIGVLENLWPFSLKGNGTSQDFHSAVTGELL
jgi:hypothetical protein